MSETGEITTSANDLGLDVEWRINFRSLASEGWYWSPVFLFQNETWYLGIFPTGCQNYCPIHRYIDPVDLGLFKESSASHISVVFSFALKTVNGEKDHETSHSTVAFKEGLWSRAVEEMLSRSELSARESELMPSGILTVVCSMEVKSTAESDSEGETSENSILTYDNELHHDFKRLFHDKEDCDVIIKVKEQEFPAHRIILKARSPVFASTFRHDMKESATGIVEIKDCDPSIFPDFLHYLYCAEVPKISQENAFSLFTVADKYQVLGLRAKCLEFIKKNLTVETFCDTITLSLLHSESELLELCIDYFTKNAPKIVVTAEWLMFLTENPTQSNELLVKLLVPKSTLHVNDDFFLKRHK